MWNFVAPSELIHEALDARDGDFFACLDCTLYRGDQSGVRGHTDIRDRHLVFLESPPNIIFHYFCQPWGSLCGQRELYHKPSFIWQTWKSCWNRLQRGCEVFHNSCCFSGVAVYTCSMWKYSSGRYCFSADLPWNFIIASSTATYCNFTACSRTALVEEGAYFGQTIATWGAWSREWCCPWNGLKRCDRVRSSMQLVSSGIARISSNNFQSMGVSRSPWKCRIPYHVVVGSSFA